MARTIRRKHRVPGWVMEESFTFVDPQTGVEVFTGYVRLHGQARQEKIRIWHRQRCHFVISIPKVHRQHYEDQHRMECKQEIARYLKDENYEIQLLPKRHLGYWMWCGCWRW